MLLMIWNKKNVDHYSVFFIVLVDVPLIKDLWYNYYEIEQDCIEIDRDHMGCDMKKMPWNN